MDFLFHLLTGMGWNVGTWFWLPLGAELLAVLSMPSVLLQRRGRPQSALAWILLLVALPWLGLVFWWLLGRTHLRRRRARHQRARDTVAADLLVRNLELRPRSLEALLPIRTTPQGTDGGLFPATQDNAVDVLVDASEAYPALERMIDEAQHHIHLLFYIWQPDRIGTVFRDRLVARARRGVEVRLLYDGVGSPDLRSSFLQPLRDAGARVASFLPFRFTHRISLNFRNHRKIVVADGAVAFTGGMNIGEEYTRDWRDLGLRLAGPAVDQFQQVFADDWLFATGENLACEPYFGRWAGRSRDREALPQGEDPAAICAVVASGPDHVYNFLQDALFLAIGEARSRVWLTTPYFIPSSTLMMALRAAVYRGVDVRLLLPGRSDVRVARLAARSYYLDLLASGVRVYEYQPKILHTKAMVFDEELCALGSANLDARSFRLNFEANCFVRSRPVTRALTDLFLEDLEQSREITAAEMQAASAPRRLLEAAAHLLSPLL